MSVDMELYYLCNLSCFGCYCRNQDKQKMKSRQTWDQRIVQAWVLAYQWCGTIFQLCVIEESQGSGPKQPRGRGVEKFNMVSRAQREAKSKSS